VIFRETRHHAQAHVTSGTHTLCPFFGREKNTRRQRSWVEEVFIMAILESQNILCARTWSTDQSGVGATLALSSFLSHIPRQKEPEISVADI
jgi:hypothetical protein